MGDRRGIANTDERSSSGIKADPATVLAAIGTHVASHAHVRTTYYGPSTSKPPWAKCAPGRSMLGATCEPRHIGNLREGLKAREASE